MRPQRIADPVRAGSLKQRARAGASLRPGKATGMSSSSAILVYCEEESRLCGVRVWRLSSLTHESRLIQKAVVESEADIVFVEGASDTCADQVRLSRLGFPYLVGETSLNYDWGGSGPVGLVGGLTGEGTGVHVQPCVPRESADFRRAVLEAGTSNLPAWLGKAGFFGAAADREGALCCYAEAGSRAWVAHDAGAVAGFLVVTDAAHRDRDGVFFGVRPGDHEAEVLRALFLAWERSGAGGPPAGLVAVSASDTLTQRVMAQRGLLPVRATSSFFLTPYLSLTNGPVGLLSLRATADDLALCGRLTGDTNAIHFDDSAAAAAGFPSRVAHGLIASGVLSRYFGTVFPGHGTVFRGYTHRFIAPVLLERTYEARISFPAVDLARGTYRAVAKIVDESGKVCLLAWCDLARR